MACVRRALLGAALVVLAGGGAALGSFPGSNGRLAYFYGGEIFVVGADGRQTRSLGPGLSPSWSPNGRELAFDTAGNVWIMRADGSGRRPVTSDPAIDYFAAWSPDGGSLVFTSDRGGEDLYLIGADGSGERRLTTDPEPDWGPAWSPDGTRIAFTGNARGNREIEVVNVDGSGRVALTDHPDLDYDPAWSPDSTRIAFTSERDGNANVYVMQSDGTGLQQLTDDPANDWRPAWSPDGTKIVFESDRDPSVFDRDLFVMNVDGSDERRLRTGDINARDADWQPTIDLGVSFPNRGRVRNGRVFLTVHNASPIPETRIALTVTAGRRKRVLRVDELGAGVVRGFTVSVPRSARSATASVSSWYADGNPANNRASVRLRR